MARIVTVTSGKGGVGKTNICVNLAIKLSLKGHRVCVFDADLGLANINIILGIRPDYTLEDVIQGRRGMDEILIRDFHGIDIIPGSSGVELLADLDGPGLVRLIESFSQLDGYDYVLFDSSAGISRNVISFCMASHEVILAIVPEPTSLTDSYSLLKVLKLNAFDNPVRVIVNRSRDRQFGKKVFEKFKGTIRKFLAVDIEFLGAVVEDHHVTDAVAEQSPFVVSYPGSAAALCMTDLAQEIEEAGQREERGGSAGQFLERCTSLIRGYLNLAGSKEEIKKQKPEAVADKAEPVPESSVEAAGSDEKATGNGDLALTEELLTVLNRLADSTEAISRELKALREGEAQDKKGILSEIRPAPVPREKESPVMSLDFERYIKDRTGQFR